jgi:hypothetical protein
VCERKSRHRDETEPAEHCCDEPREEEEKDDPASTPKPAGALPTRVFEDGRHTVAARRYGHCGLLLLTGLRPARLAGGTSHRIALLGSGTIGR